MPVRYSDRQKDEMLFHCMAEGTINPCVVFHATEWLPESTSTLCSIKLAQIFMLSIFVWHCVKMVAAAQEMLGINSGLRYGVLGA